MRLPFMPETWSTFFPVFFSGMLLLWAGAHYDFWFVTVLGAALVVVSLLVLNFYRDFERAPQKPLKPRQFVSPADGKIVVLKTATEKFYLKKPSVHIAIFMNPLNNHVQRAPFDGKIAKKVYHKGKFMAAYDDKADLVNEQSHLVVDLMTPGSRPKKAGQMVIKQIAGLLCHRIRTTPNKGDRIARGKRIGRILLGSRVDVFLPKGFKPAVKMGDQVLAGVTILGEL